MRLPAWWLRFTGWAKDRPWRYRILVALSLPTVIPVCTVLGLVSGVAGGCITFGHGVRAFIAGKPS